MCGAVENHLPIALAAPSFNEYEIAYINSAWQFDQATWGVVVDESLQNLGIEFPQY